MIEDITGIAVLDDAERDLLRQSLSRLLSRMFIIRGYKKDDGLYSFVIRNRLLVESWLECAGWSLRVDETLGLVSWRGPGAARLDFNKEETIVLAVLRLIYEEKRGEISLNSFPMITVADVLDKLRALAGFVPKKTRFTLILRRMQSLKLIQLRGDMSSESEMLLYPSLAFAFDSAAVDAFLEQIITDTDNGAEESDDDQA